MSKALLAFLSASFAAIAMAQSPTPADDAAAARQKASPENVKKATEGTAKGYTQSAGEAAAKSGGTGMSHDAKAARRKSSQANIKSATSGTEKGYTQAAGEQAAKAKGDTSRKSPAPKAQAGTPEMKKVVP